MTLLDLSLVTRSLVNLVQFHVTSSPAWSAGTTLTVSPLSPDRLSGDNTLGLYLYHLIEDVHFQNLPPPADSQLPLRYTPMGLSLSYLLTAHSDLSDEMAAYQEQLMMGCAVKALRDFPVIDDDTTINGTPVLDVRLRNASNRLKLLLQPIPYNEAVSYWTAGSTAIRLSAYYQVSVVLLEPEEPPSRRSPVLSYNVFSFVRGTPFLLSSRNVLTYTLPGETIVREAELQPAQVPFGNLVIFTGTDVTGDRTTLLLHTAAWETPLEADEQWGVAASSDRVFATIQTQIASPTGDVDILPGIYTANVRVTVQRQMADGQTQAIDFTSNAVPFAITPRIDSISPPVGGQVQVTGHLFQHPDLLADAVQLYLGSERLIFTTSGSLNPGEFQIVDASTLQLQLPVDVRSGEALPLRLLVNSVESPPNWVVVP
jgi:hypothetical protein